MIGNGVDLISTGIKGFIRLPCAGTFTRASLLADAAGSIVVDIWKDTFASYPPADADSITSSTPPTLSTDDESEDTTLASWTTSFSEGDILGFNVDSASGVKRVTLELKFTRT